LTAFSMSYIVSGIVSRSFLIAINDDPFPEGNEVFQVVLETPVGGGSIGAQFRTNVTIIDNDSGTVSALSTIPLATSTVVTAGSNFSISIQAVMNDGHNQTVGGSLFYSVIENDVNMWTATNAVDDTQLANIGVSPIGQRNSLRTQCQVRDNHNGTYTISARLFEQGHYQLRTWAAFRGGLVGSYYSDAFFNNLVLTRVDRHVNYTWGTGKILPRGQDYVSIRWTGAIMTTVGGVYHFKVEAQDHVRLWINGDLLLDHFHGQAANMEPSRSKNLPANTLAEVVLEYRKIRGSAHARLMWSTPLNSVLQVIPYKNLYGLYEISQTPLDVHVVSAATDPLTTECTGPGLYGAESLVPTWFSFCPRDKYGNMRNDAAQYFLSTQMFSAKMTIVNDMGYDGQGVERVTPTLEYNPVTFCFDGSYRAERAGRYRLRISYDTFRNTTYQEVAGSPFYLTVVPTKVSGPLSNVYHLGSPTMLTAGTCWNFTIVARDFSRNLRKVGGDKFQVYMYQVANFVNFSGMPVPSAVYTSAPTKAPSTTAFPTTVTSAPTGTRAPSARPTSMPTQPTRNQYNIFEPLSDSVDSSIRYGIVSDLGNGTYAARICPIIAGYYETHVFVNGFGVSNQPFRSMDKNHSLLDTINEGRGTYRGQYVDNSPYSLITKHATAAALATTAEGPGLTSGTAGVATWFVVTVRDNWGNILRNTSSVSAVTAVIQRSAQATGSVSVWNYHNGSYNVRYTPAVSGEIILSVYVNSVQIYNSPFLVEIADGVTAEHYTYAIGPGLRIGTTGVTQYFELFAYDLDGNRKSTNTDNFVFIVSGANNVSSTRLVSCESITDATISSHCNPTEEANGHYLGWFTPYHVGYITIHVKLLDPVTHVFTDVSNSPFTAYIHENFADASTTAISGDIYNQIAGVDSHVYLVLYDSWGNRITTGGAHIEMALLGVGVEWGTILPYATATPGLPSAYHYKGFFAGYPSVYGIVVDNDDGTYSITYNAPKAGQYVMRLALAQPGLNATYFNNTNVGYLFNGDQTLPGIAASRGFVPINFGSSISWTGDIGGRPGAQGDRSLSGTYYDRFLSRVDAMINVNLEYNVSAHGQGIYNNTDTAVSTKFKFREEYWSARWFGLITPEFAEEYVFTVKMDSSSSVRLLIGGVGAMLNSSDMGSTVVEGSNVTTLTGVFAFSDANSREIVFEYIHYEDAAFVGLYWQSLSTPYSLVPASAFSHWRNISHYNTTISPNKLCPSCSTAYGDALTSATVNHVTSFTVYARDSYGNLLQTGGEVVSAFAVGRDGILFRGDVTDYGNSTYLVTYLAVTSGDYLLYVTVGCCPPHPNVGVKAEVEDVSPLLVQGVPFQLTVTPAYVDYSRSIVTGVGAVGGVAGTALPFTVSYRDIFNNPTTFIYDASTLNNTARAKVQFVDALTNNIVSAASVKFDDSHAGSFGVTYNMTNAGTYYMSVSFMDTQTYAYTPVMSSPFRIVITPNAVYPSHTVLTGLGTREAVRNRATAFRVELFDVYKNALNVGGTRLFSRLTGDATFSTRALPQVPACTDNRDGTMVCSYSPLQSGPHNLVVKVLLNMFTPRTLPVTLQTFTKTNPQQVMQPYAGPGGAGLLGSYYTYSSPYANNFDVSVHATQTAPVFSRIDSDIEMSWPDGHLVPADGNVNLPVSSALGSGVIWTGYIVSPVSDNFTLTLMAFNLNASITCNGVLVYDQAANKRPTTSIKSQFVANAAYEIVIRAYTTSSSVTTPQSQLHAQQPNKVPRALSLRWSTANMATRPVPGFYLYPAAEEINLSPFPINVLP
jgi:hypothetical protein